MAFIFREIPASYLWPFCKQFHVQTITADENKHLVKDWGPRPKLSKLVNITAQPRRTPLMFTPSFFLKLLHNKFCGLLWVMISNKRHCRFGSLSTTSRVSSSSIIVKRRQTSLQLLSLKTWQLTPKQSRWTNSTTGATKKIYTFFYFVVNCLFKILWHGPLLNAMYMQCVTAYTLKPLRHAGLTFIKQFDKVQGMFQYDPHSFKDVTPQNTLRLRTHFQTCSETIRGHVHAWKTIYFQPNRCLGDVLNTALVPRAIWPNLWDSPTGCLATEREVEYFNSGCSLSRTRQLAGAMAFCNTEPTQNKISAADFRKKNPTLTLLRIGWPSQADLTVRGCLEISLDWTENLICTNLQRNKYDTYNNRLTKHDEWN